MKSNQLDIQSLRVQVKNVIDPKVKDIQDLDPILYRIVNWTIDNKDLENQDLFETWITVYIELLKENLLTKKRKKRLLQKIIETSQNEDFPVLPRVIFFLKSWEQFDSEKFGLLMERFENRFKNNSSMSYYSHFKVWNSIIEDKSSENGLIPGSISLSEFEKNYNTEFWFLLGNVTKNLPEDGQDFDKRSLFSRLFGWFFQLRKLNV